MTAKKALEESERKATAALTNMADGLVMFDENLNLVFCNEQYRTMFPLTADLRMPHTPAASILYASVARRTHQYSQGKCDKWVNAAVSRLRSAGTVQFLLFDGRWIESYINPAPDGTCFVVCSDITKGKRSEQILRDLNIRFAELARNGRTDGLAEQTGLRHHPRG
ncbi:PAS-domain containing protein (plasmid) [Rhizobium sp. RCAM05350]|uniref:PAS-domain containing protein n=1 Tax=Rhizobium sp. RCAM05350 TaxID=2895568 RepID=UPI0020768F60|nr:PAS-domain containing protein [Rhizobium sp. RCAM05350]URK89421.1 PAS-domain containing protein [Rhizobium sp. RCAM05350]